MARPDPAPPLTAFKPCALIPVFDHGSTVAATVMTLRQMGLPVCLVDDGSKPATASVLDALAAADGDIDLLRLPYNQGKGRALGTGLQRLQQAGFSHALQVDADGQHDLNDAASFLAAARQSPAALICGQPIYDASAPLARRYGRYLTHGCVWLETLSVALKDSMCGYRVYPLAATRQLLANYRPKSRMDFDTDIAVRLIWLGTGIINIPTRVIYPPGGLSHFRMGRDNLRISLMHAQLLLGMLWRLPRLLSRRWQVTPARPN